MSTLASKKKGTVKDRAANAQSSRARVSPARLAAFQVLRRVEEDGAFASVLLASLSDEELRADDRALCHELVLGVLRWQLWLDHLIEHYAQRRVATLDAPVRQALRLGLYQLRFLARVPQSAAVNESVNLAKQSRLTSAANFINAVLRRATREPHYDPAQAIADPIKRLAVEASHPAHLIERWIKAFGVEETKAFARANNEVPPLAFRLTHKALVEQQRLKGEKSGSDVLARLRAANAKLRASVIAPDALRVEGASGLVREMAREGLIYIQDEASQLVAHVLGAQEGESVLDVCAAPGGKTTHVAANAHDKALIFACDIHEHRLHTLLENCARQGVTSIRAITADATLALPFPENSFDRVLVDAPCSGTGTLRRNPEIRWRITNSDIAELASRQRLILAHAAQMVRPGGQLLYSTCSVELEENELIAENFLIANPAFKKVSLNAPAVLKTESGAARTWPQRDGSDGFFLSLFERKF